MLFIDLIAFLFGVMLFFLLVEVMTDSKGKVIYLAPLATYCSCSGAIVSHSGRTAYRL